MRLIPDFSEYQNVDNIHKAKKPALHPEQAFVVRRRFELLTFGL